ncbi:MAG: Gfo/Idh/MocA family protein [Spirochaetota bacterium]
MRLAVIGCGDASFAMGVASRFVRRCRIVAAVDPDRGRRERFARRYRARGFAEWSRALEEVRPDAVYIAVPHDLHRPIALECARAGTPVLLEKPVAHSLGEAELLRDEMPPGALVGVNYQYRYDPRAAALVEAGRDGALGAIRYATIEVPWFRGPEYFVQAGWHASRTRAGGGTLLTQASHALDLVLAVCGEPAAATGRSWNRFHSVEVEDLFMGVIETDAGAPVSIVSSMVSVPPSRLRVSLYGERGSLHYAGPSRATLRSRGVRVGAPIVLTQLHPYVASLAGFRDWVEGRSEYRCPLERAMPVMRACAALYESAASGRTVALRDARDGPGATGWR